MQEFTERMLGSIATRVDEMARGEMHFQENKLLHGKDLA
jgi:hypothetical protein